MSDHSNPDESQKEESKEESKDSELNPLSWAKKIMTVGVGAYFLTEDALKGLVSEFKLPKEVVSGILDGAKGVRREFMQSFVSEMMNRLSDRTDPSKVLADLLKNNEVTFEIKVKVKDKTSDKEASRASTELKA